MKNMKIKKKSRVNEAGNYTKPTMRKRMFNSIKAGSKGGKLDNGRQEKLSCLRHVIRKLVGATHHEETTAEFKELDKTKVAHQVR